MVQGELCVVSPQELTCRVLAKFVYHSWILCNLNNCKLHALDSIQNTYHVHVTTIHIHIETWNRGLSISSIPKCFRVSIFPVSNG